MGKIGSLTHGSVVYCSKVKYSTVYWFLVTYLVNGLVLLSHGPRTTVLYQDHLQYSTQWIYW